MPRGTDEYTYGMGGGASVKKGNTKKQVRRAAKQIAAEKKAKNKANYKPGGTYSTGRAIPPSPGTKKSKLPKGVKPRSGY